MPPTHANRFSLFAYLILLTISVTSVIVMHEVFMAIALETLNLPHVEDTDGKK